MLATGVCFSILGCVRLQNWKKIEHRYIFVKRVGKKDVGLVGCLLFFLFSRESNLFGKTVRNVFKERKGRGTSHQTTHLFFANPFSKFGLKRTFRFWIFTCPSSPCCCFRKNTSASYLCIML